MERFVTEPEVLMKELLPSLEGMKSFIIMVHSKPSLKELANWEFGFYFDKVACWLFS